MSQAATPPSRQQMRLRSIAWALTAGLSALLLGLPLGLEAALRAGGCGFLYGLLAFHLQRVDPDDSHLQAGLVGAVCGIHSLGLPAVAVGAPQPPLEAWLVAVAPAVMMELVRAWLPLVGAALVLHGSRRLAHRVWPLRTASRTASRTESGTESQGAGAQAHTHRP
ncbi:hypothetical protein [Cyanobium sp. CH-040]|uniref:hypothetical protein n=1 Tax=Cyanobium sp. CH-040 TaxID=2823708 RepID=UPI0028F43A8B|nr:hypothetical protein [Cyanobium sp. CH-040]